MFDFYSGETLLFNKPKEWTSFDVVNKVRNIIRRKYGKKLKVGHAGTLDPLATGLLILCTGKMTKKINEYSGLNKEYIAEITFGATTPTYDLESVPDTFFDKDHITETELKNKLDQFIGKQLQSPPIYSAKKIKGEKAYELARRGENIEMKKNEVIFHEIELLEHNLPNTAKIRLLVSKGTYIRSFAFDLGKSLNSGAYLSDLQRTKIGNFYISNAFEISDFEAKVKQTDI